MKNKSFNPPTKSRLRKVIKTETDKQQKHTWQSCREICNAIIVSSESVPSWHWLALMVSCVPLWFLCHSVSPQRANIKAEHKTLEEELFWKKERTHPYEFMDYVSTKAREETVCRLWRSRVGKNSANGAAAPPSLAAPLQKVSIASLILDFVSAFKISEQFQPFNMWSNYSKVFSFVFKCMTNWCSLVLSLYAILSL